MDIRHPDLSGINLVGFRDFFDESNQEVKDVGSEFHGTMMTGILASNGTFLEICLPGLLFPLHWHLVQKGLLANRIESRWQLGGVELLKKPI